MESFDTLSAAYESAMAAVADGAIVGASIVRNRNMYVVVQRTLSGRVYPSVYHNNRKLLKANVSARLAMGA